MQFLNRLAMQLSEIGLDPKKNGDRVEVVIPGLNSVSVEYNGDEWTLCASSWHAHYPDSGLRDLIGDLAELLSGTARLRETVIGDRPVKSSLEVRRDSDWHSVSVVASLNPVNMLRRKTSIIRRTDLVGPDAAARFVSELDS